MAHFYGRLQGNRGEATRCGVKSSGIMATVETWESVLRVDQDFRDGRNEAYVGLQGKYGGTVLGFFLEGDLIVKHGSDDTVSDAIENVRSAVTALNAIARNAEMDSKVAA
jgi:hypothetical protein